MVDAEDEDEAGSFVTLWISIRYPNAALDTSSMDFDQTKAPGEVILKLRCPGERNLTDHSQSLHAFRVLKKGHH